ncbi:MAG TPA: hypothetical protein VN922_00820, partial [Bacteroidia bacterium]|nr:hypothetical protein [Bacteroidia bacterium]
LKLLLLPLGLSYILSIFINKIVRSTLELIHVRCIKGLSKVLCHVRIWRKDFWNSLEEHEPICMLIALPD